MPVSSQEKPLTAAESARERLDSMPVSPALKEAMKPERRVTMESDSVKSLLGDGMIDVTLVFDAKEKGTPMGTLSGKLSRLLFEKDYLALNDDQKYFVVAIEAILTGNGVNASMMSSGDKVILNFQKGTYTVERAPGSRFEGGSGGLMLQQAVAIERKSAAERLSILTGIENSGLLVQALQMLGYNKYVSFEGRIKLIEKFGGGFFELVNLKLDEAGASSKEYLNGEANNYGYRGSEAQNKAMVAALVAIEHAKLPKNESGYIALPNGIFIPLD